MVIGCDGIYSKLRSKSIEDDSELNYLGVFVVLGICSCKHPLSQERVFQTANGEARLFSMPFLKNNSSYSTMWQLSMRMTITQAEYYGKNQ